jgi:hypothetical protein
MSKQSFTTQQTNSPANIRWLLIALTLLGIHQVQSLVVEPSERPFRYITLSIIGLLPLSLRLPTRVRGILWLLLGAPPVFGAFVGHLIPIVRDGHIPPASETAPLNLAGGAFLLTLGAAQAVAPSEKHDV